MLSAFQNPATLLTIAGSVQVVECMHAQMIPCSHMQCCTAAKVYDNSTVDVDMCHLVLACLSHNSILLVSMMTTAVVLCSTQ